MLDAIRRRYAASIGLAPFTWTSASVEHMAVLPCRAGAMQLLIDSRTGRYGETGEWVEAFASLWRGGRERLDDFMSLFGPQIRLSAPGLRPTVGHEAGREAFRKAFDVFPDMKASIGCWACNGEALFIEMAFSATVGGELTPWRGVDRFVIRNGVVIERIAYLNPMKVRKALLRNPTGWSQLLRLRRSRL